MKKVIAFTLFSFLTAAGYVNAVTPVHDVANTAETHATYLQTAQTTINTATQIANQVTELASMSPETLLAHKFGVESEVGKIAETVRQAQGLMNSSQKAQEAFKKAFNQVDVFLEGNTSDISRLANNKTMLTALDKTYQDAHRAAKIYADIEEESKQLQEMMKQNKDAAGNKHALQTQNALIAQQNGLALKANHFFSSLTTVVVAKYSRENMLDAEAYGIAQKHIEAIEENQKKPHPLDNLRRGYW